MRQGQLKLVNQFDQSQFHADEMVLDSRIGHHYN
jgi:hypothetical protein